jgi:hypothetical protein
MIREELGMQERGMRDEKRKGKKVKMCPTELILLFHSSLLPFLL